MTAKLPHFEFPPNLEKARELVDFEPSMPAAASSGEVCSLAVFVRDHRQRELPRRERSLEAHFADFVLAQACPGAAQAKRQALETSYGRSSLELRVAGREARAFPLGPEPAAGDSDPRSPAVVAWCDGERFYLLASDSRDIAELLPIAESIYRDS